MAWFEWSGVYQLFNIWTQASKRVSPCFPHRFSVILSTPRRSIHEASNVWSAGARQQSRQMWSYCQLLSSTRQPNQLKRNKVGILQKVYGSCGCTTWSSWDHPRWDLGLSLPPGVFLCFSQKFMGKNTTLERTLSQWGSVWHGQNNEISSIGHLTIILGYSFTFLQWTLQKCIWTSLNTGALLPVSSKFCSSRIPQGDWSCSIFTKASKFWCKRFWILTIPF